MAQLLPHKAAFRMTSPLGRSSAAIPRSTTNCGCGVWRSSTVFPRLRGHCERKNSRVLLDATAAQLFSLLLIQQNALAGDVFCHLSNVFGSAEIAPIIFVGSKAENFFSLSCYMQIAVDDRKSTLLGHEF